ncbi:hypothetical protein IWX90DRAFT_429739, partial [Phyllosticta citrichinensis]
MGFFPRSFRPSIHPSSTKCGGDWVGCEVGRRPRRPVVAGHYPTPELWRVCVTVITDTTTNLARGAVIQSGKSASAFFSRLVSWVTSVLRPDQRGRGAAAEVLRWFGRCCVCGCGRESRHAVEAGLPADLPAEQINPLSYLPTSLHTFLSVGETERASLSYLFPGTATALLRLQLQPGTYLSAACLVAEWPQSASGFCFCFWWLWWLCCVDGSITQTQTQNAQESSVVETTSMAWPVWHNHQSHSLSICVVASSFP